MLHMAWSTCEGGWPSSPEEPPLPPQCPGQELAAQHTDPAYRLQIRMAGALQKVPSPLVSGCQGETEEDKEEKVGVTLHSVPSPFVQHLRCSAH